MDISLQKLQTLTAGELAKFSGAALFAIQQQAQRAYSDAKDFNNWIETAITLKYSDQAKSIRQRLGKTTGTIHFHDDDVSITSEVLKKVTWDQSKLSNIAQSLTDKGKDAGEFIDTHYKVNEHKYTAWPDKLRTTFQGARTLKTSKPIFHLTKHQDKK